MIYYIADLHFGHENVIRHDGRPFSGVDEMEDVLVGNWNVRVTPDDTVYVLGDACWKKGTAASAVLTRLCGHKHLIRGNHDHKSVRESACWESVSDYLELVDGETRVVLSHYPMPFYNLEHKGAVMLYGHVHNTPEWQMLERWQTEPREAGIPCRMINVGCMMDYMAYTPQTLSFLLNL